MNFVMLKKSALSALRSKMYIRNSWELWIDFNQEVSTIV